MSNLIDRQATIDAINSHFGFNIEEEYGSAVQEVINGLPSVENKGEWISAKVGKLFPSNDYKCSICGNILDFDGVNCGRGDANYCPNCGAKMKGGEE